MIPEDFIYTAKTALCRQLTQNSQSAENLEIREVFCHKSRNSFTKGNVNLRCSRSEALSSTSKACIME
jgi:hypothetical protein